MRSLFGAATGVALFLGGFFALRAGSPVLAAEDQLVVVREMAKRTGVSTASALALRALHLELDEAAFAKGLDRFAALARDLGEPMAAVALDGDESLARSWLAAASSPEAAWTAHRLDAGAVAGVAFEQWRARFAARASGRE